MNLTILIPRRFLILIVVLLFCGYGAKANCYPNISAYQLYPYGPICSPQNVTLQVQYYNDYGNWVYGQFRWYYNENDPYPAQANDVSQAAIIHLPTILLLCSNKWSNCLL